MDAAELRRWCLAQRGAVEDFPFGPEHSVFKVGGKMFAISTLDRTPLEVSVKCEPELAVHLRDSHEADRTVTITSLSGGRRPHSEVRRRRRHPRRPATRT